MDKLKKKGTIKLIGLGTNEIACARALVRRPELDLIMVAGRFTLLAHHAKNAPKEIRDDTEGLRDLLKAVRQYDKKIISAAPGNSGMMYDGGNWYNYKQASPEVIAWRNKMDTVCKRRENPVPLSAAALRFPMDIAGASAIVVGPASEKQINESMMSFNPRIPGNLWDDLMDEKLIDKAQLPPPGRALV